jgi:hypothetical protein
MATHAALSADFDRARLDALGVWSVDADSDNLDITWAAPPELAGAWVPLRLRFNTDSGTESFDPDDRMFELYYRFVRNKERYCAQVQELIAELDEELGEVRKAMLVVYREGDEDEGEHFYSLSVWFHMSGDSEHLYQADYDEDEDAFTRLGG